MANEIKFYKVGDKYGEFSNFYPSPLVLFNEVWPTVEHFFQASKFHDFGVWDRIKVMKSPMDAAKEGRSRANILRDDWELVKDTVMHNGVRAKFLQNPVLKKVLLETGDSLIIEHTVNDNYWADGGDGSGKNLLGQILMKVRGELKEICHLPGVIFPPWVSFPNTDQGDMFWRMGLGEEYISRWYKYIDTFGEERYKNLFPEPLNWQGMY